MYIFFPLTVLIKNLGLKSIVWFTLMMCLVIFLSVFYFSAIELIPVFVIFTYLLFGIAYIINYQLKNIKSVIEHINTKNFDHRDIHFNSLINADFLASSRTNQMSKRKQ